VVRLAVGNSSARVKDIASTEAYILEQHETYKSQHYDRLVLISRGKLYATVRQTYKIALLAYKQVRHTEDPNVIMQGGSGISCMYCGMEFRGGKWQ
jgi:hypothetical protein